MRYRVDTKLSCYTNEICAKNNMSPKTIYPPTERDIIHFISKRQSPKSTQSSEVFFKKMQMSFTLYKADVLANQSTSGPVNAHLTPGPDIYFNAFIHVYSPGAGADNLLGTNVDVNRKPLSLCPFLASFKTISTHFFMFLHMYIAPGRGRQTPGVKILMSTERPYHYDHLFASFEKIPLNSDFIHIFLMFFHMYIALRQRQTMPWGQNFDPNRKALSL